MTTRSFSFAAVGSSLALLLLSSACSPDSVVFDDNVGVAGASSAGAPVADPGGAGGSVGSDGGTSSNSGGAGDDAAGARSTPADGGDGGAAGAPNPVPCTPTGNETCNAKDDDRNGVIDDGCPGGITTTFAKDLPLLGDSVGGSAFADDCRDGEVLSGLEVTAGAFLSQIRGVCRPLSLQLSDTADHGYRVELGEARALIAHPADSSDLPTTLACPNDEALVGVRLAQQHYTLADSTVVAVTSRLWISCAKLALVEHDGKLDISWLGPKELAPVSGSIANGTAWLVSSSAPDGLVGSRLLGTSGSWVDRVGFGVSKLDLVTR